MLVAVVFVAVGMLLQLVSAYNYCPCIILNHAPAHPQSAICESDFVIEGIQVGEREDVSAGRIYTILIKFIYKGAEKIEVGSKIEVITPSDLCGVYVWSDMLCLLAGKIIDDTGKSTFYIDLCRGWNRVVDTLTPQQNAFLGNYTGETYFGRGNVNCEICRVVSCHGTHCTSVWNFPGICITDTKPCYGETLSCQYNGGKCEWMGKKDAEKCFNSRPPPVLAQFVPAN
ncbi:metalloproteinase inhibitor 1-like [Argopecten irradians]|uniref:metalloproteinase inhibitor 1-like n=1 Tax=Argopecten irradians TaxID=31199 RepID=UPI00371EBC32